MSEQIQSSIRKVCVIGAGTMGIGIAAQVANAGLDVLLLDIAGGGEDRNEVVRNSLQRIEKSDPPSLMAPQNIERIDVGNIEDDLNRISDCDWIVEAIVERLEIKRTLYRNLLPHLKQGALVSSNTSTIPIALLMEGMPDNLRQRFCVTHFFNPVRYMRLLELVKGEETRPEVIETLAYFCERMLGKGVVECADTPGFLGNRVGVFAMQTAIYEATSLGIGIEEADALFGRPMGIPKTGVFGLYDLIGLDLMADVVRSLVSILPAGDPFHGVGGDNPLINSQIEKGYTGNKGKGGFYCEIDGKKLALDLETGKWRDRCEQIPEIAIAGEREGLAFLVRGETDLHKYCWRVLAQVLNYSANLLPQVTRSPQDIDDAMKLGYNWVRGPFEMMDELGLDWFVARLRKEGWVVPEFLRNCDGDPIYRVDERRLKVRHWDGKYHDVNLPEGVVRFSLMRRTLSPVSENESASLFHLDNGVRLVEFHTKANALDGNCMAIIAEAADDPGPGIMIHNDAQHFSAGVNLERFLGFIKDENWTGIDAFLKNFQSSVAALLYCNAPVVGAPSGLAIGGGYEVLAHCDQVIAHANSVLGLVEASVGLVPGGGGVKETYWRWYQRLGDWEKAAWNTFNQIGYGQTGSSPELSADLCYFDLDRDSVVMNRDRLVVAASEALGELAGGYNPRSAPDFVLTGGEVFSDMVKFLEKGKAKGWFYAHDVTVASAIAAIVTGGAGTPLCEVSEQDMFDSERANFINLAQTPQTLERIEMMLGGGGLIRN
ncbi:MAG: 3-hydroxyacyl-CoA dehydrogenase [Hyphomicrobiales bacterium]|nr:3-hydroxyacyl-CoA dehydrogenase [Hyphomicrobiales bacterium]